MLDVNVEQLRHDVWAGALLALRLGQSVKALDVCCAGPFINGPVPVHQLHTPQARFHGSVMAAEN